MNLIATRQKSLCTLMVLPGNRTWGWLCLLIHFRSMNRTDANVPSFLNTSGPSFDLHVYFWYLQLSFCLHLITKLTKIVLYLFYELLPWSDLPMAFLMILTANQISNIILYLEWQLCVRPCVKCLESNGEQQ